MVIINSKIIKLITGLKCFIKNFNLIVTILYFVSLINQVLIKIYLIILIDFIINQINFAIMIKNYYFYFSYFPRHFIVKFLIMDYH